MIRFAVFEQWVAEDALKRSEISNFQAKFAAKTKFTLRSLHKKIDKLIQDKENLHLKLEEATTNQKKVIQENNKGLKIILLPLHHLPLPISIKQVYHSTRGLTLLRGGLPYLCSGTRLESLKKCGSKVGQR